MMLLSVPQSLKLLSKYLPPAYYIYVVTCILQCTWTPNNKTEKEKIYIKKKNTSFLRKQF